MCTTCNQLKIRGDINAIIARMDELEKDINHQSEYGDVDMDYITSMEKCYRGLDIYLGSIEVDEEPARMALHRALGMPEPVLYEDASPSLYQGTEAELNAVVELQERMAKGMLMIQECDRVLDAAKKGKRLPYKTFMAWVNRRSILWGHWRKLKDECVALATGNNVWPEYFNLKDEPLTKWNTYGRDDEQEEGKDSRMMASIDAYALAHIEEMEDLA